MNKKYEPYLYGFLALVSLGGIYLLFRKKNGLPLIPNIFAPKIPALDWIDKTDYFTTTNGINLQTYAKAGGIILTKNTGYEKSGFSQSKYEAAKKNPKVYWAVYDIDNEKLIASSSNARQNVYGASVPKIVVGAAALDNQGGQFSKPSDYTKLIKLIVKSDNDVWNDIQSLAGGGMAVNKWSLERGYNMKAGRSVGNEANAVGMCEFYRDVCKNKFKGAEIIFRVSNSCQTGTTRSRKYMPKSVFIGGKTGTWTLENHDCCWICKDGRFYAICVLTKLDKDSDSIAQMFRGLYNEYIN